MIIMYDKENREKPFIKRQFVRPALGIAAGSPWWGTKSDFKYEIPDGYLPIAICSFYSGSNASVTVSECSPITTTASTNRFMQGINITGSEVTNMKARASILFVKEDYVTYDF